MVRWSGNVAPLRGQRGELSAHKRPDLAVKAAIRWRDSLHAIWGGNTPWFMYQVIDARDGTVVKAIY